MCKKSIIAGTVFVAVVVLFVACTASANDKQMQAKAETTYIQAQASIEPLMLPSVSLTNGSENEDHGVQYISSHAEKIKSYTTLQALNETSPYIFAGVCVSTKPVFQNDMLYTLSEVKATEVYKGDFSVGDIILIVEMGGRTTVGEYAENCIHEEKAFNTGQEQPLDNVVVMGINGYYPLEKGEEVLLFVGDETGFLDKVSQPLFAPMGAYDGKLYLQDDGSYLRLVSEQSEELMLLEKPLCITIQELEACKGK